MERAFGFTLNVPPTGTGEIAPGATVTVYRAGTLTIATIFSDDGVTPKANPFTSDATTGYWFFYAASTFDYDVVISGTGITSYTLGDISLGGVFSLNGLTTNPQTFALGTTGNDVSIVSSGSTHTFNFPDASSTARGLITTGAQTIGGDKTFGVPIKAASGGTGISAVPVNGQTIIGRTSDNTFVLSTLTATNNQTTITNGAGSITIGTVQNIGTGNSPTFAGLTLTSLVGPGIVGATGAGVLNVTTLTNGQLLIGSTASQPVAATLTAGANVTITNDAGSITIASAGAIASLNGLTAATQTFATGTSAAASDFFIDSVGSTHTFNLPNANTGVRGAVSTGNQSFDGIKTFNDPPIFYPGTQSTNTAVIGGVLHANATAVTSSGTSEFDLMTYTLKAGTLSSGAKGLRITAAGRTDGSNNSKDFQLYFGTSIVTVNTNNAFVNDLYAEAIILRVDATHQIAMTLYGHDDPGHAATVALRPDVATPVQDLGTDITIKTTATCAAGGAIDGLFLLIEVIG